MWNVGGGLAEKESGGIGSGSRVASSDGGESVRKVVRCESVAEVKVMVDPVKVLEGIHGGAWYAGARDIRCSHGKKVCELCGGRK